MWSSEVHLIDWSQFFHSVFKPIPGITTYHHFKVSKAEPGIVVVKEYANSPEAKLEIEKKDVNATKQDHPDRPRCEMAVVLIR